MGAMEHTDTRARAIEGREDEHGTFQQERKDDFPMIGLLQGEEKEEEEEEGVVNSKLNRASGRDCSASTSTD